MGTENKTVGICANFCKDKVIYLYLKSLDVSHIFRSEASIILRVGENQLGGGAERRSFGETQRESPGCGKDVGNSLVLIISEKCFTDVIPSHLLTLCGD